MDTIPPPTVRASPHTHHSSTSSAEGVHRPPRWRPEQYADWECLEERNCYGGPVVHPGHYEDIHFPASVPRSGGSPPVCSCGWTRFHDGSRFIELAEHIAEQGEFGSLTVPVTVHGHGSSHPARHGVHSRSTPSLDPASTPSPRSRAQPARHGRPIDVVSAPPAPIPGAV